MTYLETSNGIQITKARALEELTKHHCADADSIAAFFSDLGTRELYSATAVLQWLGY